MGAMVHCASLFCDRVCWSAVAACNVAIYLLPDTRGRAGQHNAEVKGHDLGIGSRDLGSGAEVKP